MIVLAFAALGGFLAGIGAAYAWTRVDRRPGYLPVDPMADWLAECVPPRPAATPRIGRPEVGPPPPRLGIPERGRRKRRGFIDVTRRP